MMKPSRPVIRYLGGKWLLAPWIISHFAPHRLYVEPYMGAANVLLRKPRSFGETINDLNAEVTNLFRVLRNPTQAEELTRLLVLTPFSRDEFLETFEPAPCPVEQARRTIARSYLAHGGAVCEEKASGTGFRGVVSDNVNAARYWAGFPHQVRHFTERLRGVIIENRPALEVIQMNDAANVLFYVDPPYPASERNMRHRYNHEMTDDQHRELAAVLRSVTGMVVLSGYPCALYDRELYPDWHRVERTTLADSSEERTEVLWLNPACVSALQRVNVQPALLEVA